MLAVLMGAMCIGAGIARLGTIAELLSRPVRVGYLNGIALVVFIGQLPKLFGFSTDANGLSRELRTFVVGVRDGRAVPAATIIGLLSLAVILVAGRWLPAVPGVLLAVVGAIVAVERV